MRSEDTAVPEAETGLEKTPLIGSNITGKEYLGITWAVVVIVA
ncbi:hypothetical protein [Methanomethylovorans sp.]